MEHLVTERLIPACQSLSNQARRLNQTLQCGIRWARLPEVFGSFSEVEDAHRFIADSVTNLDVLPDGGGQAPSVYGVASVGKELANELLLFNQAKEELQNAVSEIKKLVRPSEKNITLSKLLTGDDSSYCRDRRIRDALSRSGFSAFDLLACYKGPAVILDEVKSVSWTWQKKRRELIRMTHSQAERYIRSRLTSEAQEVSLAQLAQLPENEIYARIRTQPHPQLRANIVLTTPTKEHESGRFLISATKMLFVTQEREPRTRFAPRPNALEDQDRLIRSDVKIDDKPVIPAMNLYRYLPGKDK